jgi:beta-glucosidase
MIEEEQIQSLLAQMTIHEKIGQLQQLGMENTEEQRALVRAGCVGSMLNVSPGDGTTPAQAANALQRIAVTESRLGIPLIFEISHIRISSNVRWLSILNLRINGC